MDFHDPHVAVIPNTREHPELAGRESVGLSAETLAAYDGIVIATDHDAVDYELVCSNAKLVVDTRNICAKRGLTGDNIVKA